MRRIALIVPVVCLLVGGAVAAAPAQAAGHQLIQGSGSSWAANAVTQWITDVQAQGTQVVFSATGSAQGRHDFASKTADFAVTDLPYQGTDPATGASDTSNGRAYGYLPLVAGGTAFPYHLEVGGSLVRNLRLSGATLAKIFTGAITDWDDPAITADNNGHALPSLPIIPVVHGEGSGASYHVSDYLSAQYPSIWKAGATEYFPASANAIRQSGSDQVMNYLASSAANGAIGYDEYSYALGKNYPVAKVGNAGGYYTSPSQYNVAVALTQARIDTNKNSSNYLVADLHGVYTYTDPRTYPLSSYSYMIIPTSTTDATMNTAKRQTLADFTDYAVCKGQAEMERIGYSPLPLNLVQAAFGQISRLKDADPDVDLSRQSLSSCDNPTFDKANPSDNLLARTAPQPAACDRQGAGPCGITSTPVVALAGGTRVRAGSTDALLGRVTTDGKADVGTTVALYASAGAKGSPRWVAAARTDSGGRVRFAPRVWHDTRYELRAAYSSTSSGSAAGGVAGSNDLDVAAYYGVTAHADHAAVKVGHTVTISGSVTPTQPGDVVVLQRLLGGRWSTVASAIEQRRRGSSAVGYAVRYRVGTRSSYTLRVTHAATSTNAAGSSPSLTVRGS